MRGKEASFPFYPAEAPVDAGIVGIVDHWDLGLVACRSPASSARSCRRRSTASSRAPSCCSCSRSTSTTRRAGAALLAVDGVGAGVHEKVLIVLEGRAAGEALGKKAAPVDAAIVGIIDHVDIDGHL